MGLIILGWFNL